MVNYFTGSNACSSRYERRIHLSALPSQGKGSRFLFSPRYYQGKRYGGRTSHVSVDEHLVLVAEAQRHGIERIVGSYVRDDTPLELRRQLAGQGAVIERCGVGMNPKPLIESARRRR